MAPREPKYGYLDPLDALWIGTAQRIGFVVVRSTEVYASSDGRGTLTVGTPETLDADDCLAQMIFHEMCHSLIEGPEGLSRPDFGLDNETGRDVPREHACLRLQAQLAREHGLRAVLAPTTEFRAFYDDLGDDPLAAPGDPSVPLAQSALARVDDPPWGPHLRRALAATATIARAAAEAGAVEARDPTGRPTLYALVPEDP